MYETMTAAEKQQVDAWMEFQQAPLMFRDLPTDVQVYVLSDMRKYNTANPPVQIKLREKYTTGTKIPFFIAPKAQ